MPFGETMRMLKCGWVRLDRSRCHRDLELDSARTSKPRKGRSTGKSFN
jgi:hypothetical protein